MKGIYKFNADFGRCGDLSGIFVRDSEDIETIMGHNVYFGEALGKHSEVSLDMEPEHFRLVTQDQRVVREFEEYGFQSGINPFHYVYDDEDDEDEDVYEDGHY